MIARVAQFTDSPDRFTAGHAYGYVLDAISTVEGLIAAYHLAGQNGSMSISIWADEPAMRAGETAVGEARERLQIAGSPPDRVETYTVANSRRP